MNSRGGGGELGVAPISVIIPCFHCADTIQRAVDSVVTQTLHPAEILLVDDFSNDERRTINALEQIRHLYAGMDIRILSLSANNGPGSARNAGWNEVSQPYVAFLDADDSWHPKKLEIQYKWMKSHPSVMLTGHESVTIEECDAFQPLPTKLLARWVGKYALLFANRFPTRSVMLKQELPYRFVEAKRYSEDYLLWLTIVLAGHSAVFLNCPLAYSYKEDFGDGGLTGNLCKTQQGELDTYERIRDLGLISNVTYVAVVSFSVLKFIRRRMVVFLRARWK